LIAPYTKDARQWRKLRWIDVYSGEPFTITTRDAVSGERTARVQSNRDVIARYRVHPEAKSLGLDGVQCGKRTVGLLGRRVVQETYVAHVGKEANKLEEVEAGLEHDPEVIYTEYARPQNGVWQSLSSQLARERSVAGLACELGISKRAVYSMVSGHSQPRPRIRAAIARIARNSH
jgi:hypothetical protein